MRKFLVSHLKIIIFTAMEIAVYCTDLLTKYGRPFRNASEQEVNMHVGFKHSRTSEEKNTHTYNRQEFIKITDRNLLKMIKHR